jgi:zinc transporter
MNQLRDDQGLIWGFRLGRIEPCSREVLQDDRGAGTWLHFNLNDARARSWLDQHSGFAEDALEQFLEVEARPSMRVYRGAVVFVVSDMHHEFNHRSLDPDAADFGALRIYLDSKRIITGRRHPLKTIDLVRRDMARQTELAEPIEVLENFLEQLADTFAETVSALSQELDDAEDRILTGRFRDQSSVLNRDRRMLVRLRRSIGANASALSGAADAIARLFAGDHRERVARSLARLGALAQEIDFVLERSRILQEEIANHLSETTNRNLYVLSTVTTTLLPITLITGIFGMNVGGLPWANSPNGFAGTMVLITLSVVVTLFALRSRAK